MPVHPFEAVERDELRWLYGYWKAKRGERSAPGRADIDPLEMPKLLPSLSIIDRPNGAYRVRLCGSKLAEIYGRELTGAPVAPETFGDSTNYWISLHDRLFERCEPLFGMDSLAWDGRKYIVFDWGAFPVVDDTGAVCEELWCLLFKNFG